MSEQPAERILKAAEVNLRLAYNLTEKAFQPRNPWSPYYGLARISGRWIRPSFVVEETELETSDAA